MANTIKIKRSTSTATPSALAEGELAYSENSNNLFIGTSGSNVENIGGKIGVTVQAYDANIVSDSTYQSTANDFTNTLKNKLDGVEASATADQTGAEIKTAYEAEANAYTDTKDTKLSGIETSANNYSHPTSAGNKHVPTGGASGQFLKYSASGTAVWSDDNNTTYTVGDGGLSENNLSNALKTNYDAAYSWYNTMTTADGNSVIDTVNEIVSAFENHAEGLNLITELDAKLTASSTIDGGTF